MLRFSCLKCVQEGDDCLLSLLYYGILKARLIKTDYVETCTFLVFIETKITSKTFLYPECLISISFILYLSSMSVERILFMPSSLIRKQPYLLEREVPQDCNRTRIEGIYIKISGYKVIRGLKPCNEMAKKYICFVCVPQPRHSFTSGEM